MAHTFEDLVTLEQAAETAHHTYLADSADPAAARRVWIEAAARFQAGVTEYAAAEGTVRYEVEMAAKKAVRYPAAEAA